MYHPFTRIMDNTIFFQHQDLIRSLSVHETAMQLMVKTLKRSTLQPVQITPLGTPTAGSPDEPYAPSESSSKLSRAMSGLLITTANVQEIYEYTYT